MHRFNNLCCAKSTILDFLRGHHIYKSNNNDSLVQPAALMPNYVEQNGAYLVIVNLSKTPCDEIFDVLIQGKAGEVLPIDFVE